jgi:PPR repeat
MYKYILVQMDTYRYTIQFNISKHYTCVVDMLGRAKWLEEAYNLSKEQAYNLSKEHVEGADKLMLWSALLSACQTHKQLDMAAEAMERVAEFDQDIAGPLVVMSNTYISAGKWKNAVDIWSKMWREGIHKEPGCSWVEIKVTVYVFYVGEISSSGSRAGDVMDLLEELEVKMREGICG